MLYWQIYSQPLCIQSARSSVYDGSFEIHTYPPYSQHLQLYGLGSFLDSSIIGKKQSIESTQETSLRCLDLIAKQEKYGGNWWAIHAYLGLRGRFDGRLDPALLTYPGSKWVEEEKVTVRPPLLSSISIFQKTQLTNDQLHPLDLPGTRYSFGKDGPDGRQRGQCHFSGQYAKIASACWWKSPKFHPSSTT